MQHCRPEDAAQCFSCLWGTRQAGYSQPAWIQLFLDKELGSVIAQGPPPPCVRGSSEAARSCVPFTLGECSMITHSPRMLCMLSHPPNPRVPIRECSDRVPYPYRRGSSLISFVWYSVLSTLLIVAKRFYTVDSFGMEQPALCNTVGPRMRHSGFCVCGARARLCFL